MDMNPTQLPVKLLLNAESFGFGPTAAIADFFPYLRKSFQYIGFVGRGHSLDLQRSFEYDEIIDLSGREPSAFDAIVSEYDLFFTALHFDKAERAAALGIPTIIYDPLTWFWPEIPPVVARKEVLYLAQGFHGVKKLIQDKEKKFGQPLVVPPLIKRVARESCPTILLLNLGGLINPFWSIQTCCDYAIAMIRAVKEVADPSLELRILCSSQVVRLIPDEGIQTFSREEVKTLLPQVRIAIQTPGLANIYDAAAHDLPTLFLPPANDSQGQQLDLLRDHDQVDACIDWDELPCGKKIRYRGEQKNVLEQIGYQVEHLACPETARCLSVLIRDALEELTGDSPLRLPTLLDRFGEGGAEQVANFVEAKAQKELIYV